MFVCKEARQEDFPSAQYSAPCDEEALQPAPGRTKLLNWRYGLWAVFAL